MALQAVLQDIRRAGLPANPEKCTIGKEKTLYLGFQVGSGWVWPLMNEVELQTHQAYWTKKQVRALFLGLVNYYRKFVPHIVECVVPLMELT